MTISECILKAKMVKINKRDNKWAVTNCLKKQLELFKKLNTPLDIEQLIKLVEV